MRPFAPDREINSTVTSPLGHTLLRHHQGIAAAVPAIAATEPEVEQRHVTLARVHEVVRSTLRMRMHDLHFA